MPSAPRSTPEAARSQCKAPSGAGSWRGRSPPTAGTIAIDSENVAAHYGLGLAYTELARGELDRAAAFDPDELRPERDPHGELVAGDRRGGRPEGQFRGPAPEKAMLLYNGVEKFVNRRAAPVRLAARTALTRLVETLGPRMRDGARPRRAAGLARLLEHTHKSLHMMLKPDETAEGRAVAIARRDNPAADQNAQSIVIHPLHRSGASKDAGE